MVLSKENNSTGTGYKSAFLSLIPEQGPFHVFLNFQEGVLQMSQFILANVYKKIFRSDLPVKPKPFRIQLLITAVFPWMVKHLVKSTAEIQLWKDIELVCLLHLLEVIPLSFDHYPVTFQ